MAKIGLKYPVVGALTETASAATYASGAVIGKAISADISVNSNDVKLYADDVIAESDKSFKDGTITLGIDDLSDDIQALILGHDVTEGVLSANTADVAPFVGVGFYAPTKKNNVLGYRAIFLKKVQFAEPAMSMQTKGETVAFQTPSVVGTIFADVTGEWKQEQSFTSETEAKAWLNGLVSITA